MLDKGKKISIEEVKDLTVPIVRRFKQMEAEAFGDGGFNEWVIPVFARYGKVYALRSGSKYIGLAHFIRDFNDNSTCFLAGFSLDKDHRGRGLGTFFLNEVLKKLKRKKIGKILLTVALDNEPALKMYNGLGFERTKLLRNEYGKGINCYLLTIDLERIKK